MSTTGVPTGQQTCDRPQAARQTRCPLCGDSKCDNLGAVKRQGALFTFVTCHTCQLVRMAPLPSRADLDDYYARRYRIDYKGVSQPKMKHVYRGGLLALRRLTRFRKYVREGASVLDIGCGAGEWLYVLQEAGYAVTGLEPDPGYGRFASRELSVPVKVESMWDAQFGKGDFEAITLFHVLEHLSDPVGALVRCRDWLQSEGAVVVEVPNIASPHQHPGKKFHPAHLFGFTRETLSGAAARAGLIPLEVSTDRFERNIFAVFRRGSCETHPIESHRHPRVKGRSLRSTVEYYMLPTTYARFGSRMAQFGREIVSVYGKKDAREILDSLVQREP